MAKQPLDAFGRSLSFQCLRMGICEEEKVETMLVLKYLPADLLVSAKCLTFAQIITQYCKSKKLWLYRKREKNWWMLPVSCLRRWEWKILP